MEKFILRLVFGFVVIMATLMMWVSFGGEASAEGVDSCGGEIYDLGWQTKADIKRYDCYHREQEEANRQQHRKFHEEMIGEDMKYYIETDIIRGKSTILCLEPVTGGLVTKTCPEGE